MLERNVRCAVIQLTSSPDVDANLARADVLVRAAAEAGANLIALPENTPYLGPEGESARHATNVRGDVVGHFRELALEQEVVVLLGSFVEKGPGDGRTHNTSVLISPDGNIVATYRKMHLFDVETPSGHVLRESDNIAPGDTPVTAELGPWVAGLSVCYDLRFPELYRVLVERGSHILFVPSAFTAETGRDHWIALLRARAIENLCYVVAPDQAGHHFGKRRSYGRSVIIDPWGTVLACCPDRPSFAVAELDLDALESQRRRFPCLDHRRLE